MPSLRKICTAALAALAVAVGALTLVDGYSSTPLLGALQFLAVIGLGVVVIGGAIGLALVELADWRAPEEDFERIVERVERLGSGRAPSRRPGQQRGDADYDDPADYDGRADYDDRTGDDDLDAEDAGSAPLAPLDAAAFRALVRSAERELPLECCAALEHVAIVVADVPAVAKAGRASFARYGLYERDGAHGDYFHARVLIFRDRLLRDFGNDVELLREQIRRTLAHELTRAVDPRSGHLHRS